MFLKSGFTKIMIIYVVKLEDYSYKIMYVINNQIFNDRYKGMVVLINHYKNIDFLYNKKLIGRWIYANLDNYGNILRIY